MTNKDSVPMSSPTLNYMTRTRTWPGNRRGSGSGSTPSVPIGDAARVQSILQGMRAIARPNGEPRRSVLEILDDAIALEDTYQRSCHQNPQRDANGDDTQ
ncbi:expressed unknown protein [Seminavis robusta]|uniref:Uncharacterized protein n=1 Tax=Seminavis robusta TaxID=568900 RepID=A0A9N8DZG2_9STRA|nr:expressed unknown protein [Seminavis robusta]|eukprot:Sro389_g132720.1 n/a (100) ;mRNA; f:68947-69246